MALLTLALTATVLSINLHHQTTAGGAARLPGYLDSSLANLVLHFWNASHIQSTIRIIQIFYVLELTRSTSVLSVWSTFQDPLDQRLALSNSKYFNCSL